MVFLIANESYTLCFETSTKQCAHFSFHKFWTNGAKFIELRAIFVVGNQLQLKTSMNIMDPCHIGPFVGTFTLQI